MDFDDVRASAAALPGVEVTTTWGAPALKVRGRMFVCEATHKSAEPDTLVVRMDFAQRDALVAEDPETYYLKDHYLDYSCVLVRLSSVHPDALRDLVRTAYRFASAMAPARKARSRAGMAARLAGAESRIGQARAKVASAAGGTVKRAPSSRGNPERKPAANVDAYLKSLPAEKRAALQRLRKIISAAAPGAEAGFSYGLPAFKLNGRPLVAYGAATNHCSFFPMSPAVIRAHAAALKGYDISKGTIRFLPEKPLPVALVRKLVKARIAELEPDPK